MRWLSLWMRTHPLVGDCLVAVLVALVELLSLFDVPGGVNPVVYWLVGVGLVVPLALRRRHPVAVAYVVLGAGLVQLLTHGPVLDHARQHDATLRLADVALGISLYTLVAYVGRRHALRYVVLVLVGMVLWGLWRIGLDHGGVIAMIVVTIILAFCWVLGEFVGARRAYQSEVERRLALLETERDQQARIAVARERTRIARELHDVVAHAVSVIVVQADGAAYAVRGNPELAERAVATISSTGRSALAELRGLLGVLRSEDGGDGALAPQPGAGSLTELAQRVRDVGLPVALTVTGELDDLPTGVGLGIYRIVQEALTNTLKHAGPGASATVLVTREAERVRLEVTDDGAGGPVRELVGAGSGNGLIGMRERANVYGGSLAAGPGPGGGWCVRAVLPVGGA